jgi:hypothetical protein
MVSLRVRKKPCVVGKAVRFLRGLEEHGLVENAGCWRLRERVSRILWSLK